MDRVLVGPGCWEWDGAHSKDGYGYVWRDGKVVPAHVAVYEAVIRPLEPGEELDHECRNHGCVRPGDGHTEAVTHKVNMERGIWATKTHCPANHPYDEENTKVTREGWRQCRICQRKHWHTWKEH